MSIIEEMKKLPRKEMLIFIETIWNDLSSNESFDFSQWHQQKLLKTEERLKNGQESILEWDSATQSLHIDSFVLYPGIYKVVFGCHQLLISHFPYTVYYKIDGNEIFDCSSVPKMIEHSLRQ